MKLSTVTNVYSVCKKTTTFIYSIVYSFLINTRAKAQHHMKQCTHDIPQCTRVGLCVKDATRADAEHP